MKRIVAFASVVVLCAACSDQQARLVGSWHGVRWSKDGKDKPLGEEEKALEVTADGRFLVGGGSGGATRKATSYRWCDEHTIEVGPWNGPAEETRADRMRKVTVLQVDDKVLRMEMRFDGSVETVEFKRAGPSTAPAGQTERVVQLRCGGCGNLNSEDAKFCQDCGRKL